MSKSFYKKFLVVALVLVVVIAASGFSGGFIQNFVYKIIQKPGGYVTDRLLHVSKFSSKFLESRAVIEENARLREENNSIRGLAAEAEALKRENKFLRNELGVAKRLNSPLLLAQIFNIQRSGPSSTALINMGAADGVEKFLPVITAGNILVGVIGQVFKESSLVLLLDDPRVKISGRVQGSSVLTEVRGELQDNLKLGLVSNEDEINEGDSIVTSGLDGLPEALLVARVTGVDSPSGALFKNVTARPFFDPSLGSSLFVILR